MKPEIKLQPNIPRHELEALARCFLPDIRAFYQREEGQRKFEEWKRKAQESQKGEGE